MDALTAIVIDDEPQARERLTLLLAEAGVDVVATLADAGAALDWLGSNGNRADAAFVNVQMPRMDGVTLAGQLAILPHPPAIVFASSQPQPPVFTIDGLTVDHLLKPVRRDRLAAVLARLMSRPSSPAGGAPGHFSVIERGHVRLVPIESALYLKAELKYVTLRTLTGEHLLDMPLTQLEEEYGDAVVRVHRNCLVLRHAIAGFERNTDGAWYVMLNGSPERVPVSRRQQFVVKLFR